MAANPTEGQGEANSAKIAEIRARAEALRDERSKGYPHLDSWGPKCRGCGVDEYRHDGYCSMECRDWSNDDEAADVACDVLALVEVAEAAQDYFRLTHPSPTVWLRDLEAASARLEQALTLPSLMLEEAK